MRPPLGLVRVPHDAVVEGEAELAHRGVAAEVLVGQEEHLAVAPDPAAWSKAQSRAVRALDEVQIVPPCRPVKALIAAEEFM